MVLVPYRYKTCFTLAHIHHFKVRLQKQTYSFWTGFPSTGMNRDACVQHTDKGLLEPPLLPRAPKPQHCCSRTSSCLLLHAFVTFIPLVFLFFYRFHEFQPGCQPPVPHAWTQSRGNDKGAATVWHLAVALHTENRDAGLFNEANETQRTSKLGQVSPCYKMSLMGVQYRKELQSTREFPCTSDTLLPPHYASGKKRYYQSCFFFLIIFFKMLPLPFPSKQKM